MPEKYYAAIVDNSAIVAELDTNFMNSASKLPAPVQSLIKLIFNINEMVNTLKNFELNG